MQRNGRVDRVGGKVRPVIGTGGDRPYVAGLAPIRVAAAMTPVPVTASPVYLSRTRPYLGGRVRLPARVDGRVHRLRDADDSRGLI